MFHLSVHSFTPTLDGQTRNADAGLLYDPGRPRERECCTAWQRAMRTADPRLRVRRNYPYRGVSDGLTTHLRRVFPPEDYLGIELELNQAIVARDGEARRALMRTLTETLHTIIWSP